MDNQRTSRIVAAVLIGLASGLFEYHKSSERTESGKDAYLAAEAKHYDRMYSEPRNPLLVVYGMVAVVVTAFGVYEGIAFGIFTLLEKRKGGASHRSVQ